MFRKSFQLATLTKITLPVNINMSDGELGQSGTVAGTDNNISTHYTVILKYAEK